MIRNGSEKGGIADMDNIYGFMPIVGPVLLAGRMIGRWFRGDYSSNKSSSEGGDGTYRNEFLDDANRERDNFNKGAQRAYDDFNDGTQRAYNDFLSEANRARDTFLASVA